MVMKFSIRKSTLAIAVALLVMPLLAGCASRSTKVSEVSYKINFDKDGKDLPGGDFTFVVTNDSTDQAHEFVIFQTDLPEDQLPTNTDGSVDEEGQGVTHIDEVEDIAPGESKTLKVNLPPGNYVALCNLTDPSSHYQAGMHWAFTVK